LKVSIRILLISAIVLIMGLGAWYGVRAEQGSADNRSGAVLSNLFLARVLGTGSNASEPETETPQATEDVQGQQQVEDGTAEPVRTPEAGDDNQGQNSSMDSPERQGELTGTVTAIDANTVTIDGTVFNLTGGSEHASNLQVGDFVKVEFVTNADGSLSVTEIKPGDQSGNSGDSSQSGSDDSSGSDHGGKSSSDSGGHDGGDDSGGNGGSGG
jgi:uncharacterized membrane protein YgcG